MGYDLFFEHPCRDTADHYHHRGTVGRVGSSSFSVNISGMAWLREVMTELDLLDWDAPAPDITLQYEAVHSLPEDDPVVAAFYANELETGKGPLVPAFKLCSNDFRLVTPTEIRSALDAYAVLPPPHALIGNNDQYLWAEWIEFMNGALDHGGFRVG